VKGDRGRPIVWKADNKGDGSILTDEVESFDKMGAAAPFLGSFSSAGKGGKVGWDNKRKGVPSISLFLKLKL